MGSEEINIVCHADYIAIINNKINLWLTAPRGVKPVN